MIKKVRDDIFIVENFYPHYKELYNHAIENQHLSHVAEGCTIKRYDIMPHEMFYESKFIDLCQDYINEIENIVEKINKFSIHKKGNFIVGFSIYDIGSNINPHTDLYDIHDQENQHVCSTVHYLNDDYVGGEIVFSDISLEIKPIENMLLIFDSSYLHYTKPIISGKKVSSTRFWKREGYKSNVRN